jgi:hypothetical protein
VAEGQGFFVGRKWHEAVSPDDEDGVVILYALSLVASSRIDKKESSGVDAVISSRGLRTKNDTFWRRF